MGPLSGSLVVRLTGILLVAVVLFNIAMAIALYAPIGEQRSDVYRMPPADQAVAIVNLIEPSSGMARAQVLTAINSNALHVTIVSALPQAGVISAAGLPVQRYINEYDAAFPGRDLHVELNRPGFFTRLYHPSDREWEPSRLYVRLHDGSYVLFEPTRGAVFDTFLARGLFLMGLFGIVVLVGLVLAVRQTARPITRLSRQARMLGDTLEAPDIVVAGPREVRDLALAFNHMKERIAALVTQRTRLVAAIAHDLRTYLTRLRLRADFISDDDQRNRAERDIGEMEALVDDTLAFAAADNGPADPHASVQLAGEIGRFLETRRETGDPITLTGSVAPDLRVTIDPLSLKRILSNLCENAVRYGEHARISIDAGLNECTIHVDDDGPGVPETDLPRMTVPFERLEPSRARSSGGAGLGLAIVAVLTKGYGGHFTIANRSGGLRASVMLKRA